MATKKQQGVTKALQAELSVLRRRDRSLADSALAASALALAREMDSPETPPAAVSMCARELREVLGQIRELAPKDDEKDKLDELTARRAARRSRSTASADTPPS